MKVLFLVTQSEFGGAQRYILEVATHLDHQKYEVLVAAGQGNGEFFQKLQDTEVRTMYLKWMKRAPWPWQLIFSIIEIYSLLKKEKPDILFLCSTTTGLLGSISALFYKKVKIIYRIGGWSFRDPRPFWQNKILLWAEKLTAPFKDKIIVNSEVDRQEAIKLKICPPERIVKIYNGIDSSSLNFIPKETAQKQIWPRTTLDQIAGQLWVGTVANFYKTKGISYLIEAVHLLNTKYLILNTKYLIIGDGKERQKLESLIKKYNLENQIFLLGRISDAYKYLKAFDLFVLPSLKEGFPWIILEVMAAEVPIVATRVGAIPEVIKESTEGILIKPGDSEILAEKIYWILNHREEMQSMILRAKEELKRFDLEKMMEETEKLLTN